MSLAYLENASACEASCSAAQISERYTPRAGLVIAEQREGHGNRRSRPYQVVQQRYRDAAPARFGLHHLLGRAALLGRGKVLYENIAAGDRARGVSHLTRVPPAPVRLADPVRPERLSLRDYGIGHLVAL